MIWMGRVFEIPEVSFLLPQWIVFHFFLIEFISLMATLSSSTTFTCFFPYQSWQWVRRSVFHSLFLVFTVNMVGKSQQYPSLHLGLPWNFQVASPASWNLFYHGHKRTDTRETRSLSKNNTNIYQANTQHHLHSYSKSHDPNLQNIPNFLKNPFWRLWTTRSRLVTARPPLLRDNFLRKTTEKECLWGSVLSEPQW